MIECATRAPSGHNTQPWLFAVRPGEISIRPDFEKSLPIVDPDYRELFISLGCAAENLCLAASERQYLAETEISENGEILIRLNPSQNVSPHPLFPSIAQRQTNRRVYSGEKIPETLLDDILKEFAPEKSCFIHAWPRGSQAFDSITQYVMEGNAAQMSDAAFKAELLAWVRFNRKHAERTGDGLSYAALGAPGLPAWLARPIVQAALNGKKQNASDLRKIRSSSHFALLTSRENTVAAWIQTGRVLQRFLLHLTRAGIAHAYLNPPCEIPALARKLRARWLADAEFAQILLRIGYGKPLPYALRKPLPGVISDF